MGLSRLLQSDKAISAVSLALRVGCSILAHVPLCDPGGPSSSKRVLYRCQGSRFWQGGNFSRRLINSLGFLYCTRIHVVSCHDLPTSRENNHISSAECRMDFAIGRLQQRGAGGRASTPSYRPTCNPVRPILIAGFYIYNHKRLGGTNEDAVRRGFVAKLQLYRTYIANGLLFYGSPLDTIKLLRPSS